MPESSSTLAVSRGTLRQSSDTESLATPTSRERGLSRLRRRQDVSQCEGRDRVKQSESSRVLPVMQSESSYLVKQSESSRVLPVTQSESCHSAVHSAAKCDNIKTEELRVGLNQSSPVREVMSGDEDGLPLSSGSMASGELDGHVRLRRRLGMTRQVTRPPTVVKLQDKVEHELNTTTSLSATQSTSKLNRSYTNLLRGLSQHSGRNTICLLYTSPSPRD